MKTKENKPNNQDQLLIDKYIKGDTNAINDLVGQYYSKVFSYVNMMVKDRQMALDITQDSFIKAIHSIDNGKYSDNGRFISWVVRIAHNQIIDHFRSKKLGKTISENEAGFDILSNVNIEVPSIEDDIEKEQSYQGIRQLVEELPDEQKEVILLRHFVGMNFNEIAEQTGVSINTSLGRMRYALINLRKIINQRKINII